MILEWRGLGGSRGAHLADHVALGVLASVFPRFAVAAAIDAAGAREQRSRVLTAYYVLGARCGSRNRMRKCGSS